MPAAEILIGDVRTRLHDIPDNSIQTCITSPPYWGLRDYGHDGQIGLEQTPDEYVTEMVAVFREVRRVLKDDGVLWLNLGDSYANVGVYDLSKVGGFTGQRIRNRVLGQKPNDGVQDSRPRKIPSGLKNKDLVGIPWRVAFALQADGWWLRQDIIWHKPNPMPESVTDRCTKAHEYLFLLTKSAKYYFDNEAIKEPATTNGRRPTLEERYAKGEPTRHGLQGAAFHGAGGFGVDDNGKRNRRSVWTIPTKPFRGAHFAVMPEALVEPCIHATSRPDDTVLDPFTGSGTVAVVALRHGRNYIGTELNPDYVNIAQQRITAANPMFNQITIR
jgi:DNA modification methylase